MIYYTVFSSYTQLTLQQNILCSSTSLDSKQKDISERELIELLFEISIKGVFLFLIFISNIILLTHFVQFPLQNGIA